MNVLVNISGIQIDNLNAIQEHLEKKKNFQLQAFDSSMTDNKGWDIDSIEIWLESKDKSTGTIMLDLTIEDAAFFAKSLLILTESIKNR